MLEDYSNLCYIFIVDFAIYKSRNLSWMNETNTDNL